MCWPAGGSEVYQEVSEEGSQLDLLAQVLEALPRALAVAAGVAEAGHPQAQPQRRGGSIT